jgi:transcriptional regulator with XRE-family HTH domain
MPQYLPSALRFIREEAGISLADLAIKAQISPRALYYIERQGIDPRISTLCRIATALNVSLEAFVIEGAPKRSRRNLLRPSV